jgi:hypothetical protein
MSVCAAPTCSHQSFDGSSYYVDVDVICEKYRLRGEANIPSRFKYIMDFNIRDTCMSIMECSEIERRTIPVEEEVSREILIGTKHLVFCSGYNAPILFSKSTKGVYRKLVWKCRKCSISVTVNYSKDV